MPYKLKKNKDGTYRVESPHGVKAKKTTLKNAYAQIRLLNQKKQEKKGK